MDFFVYLVECGNKTYYCGWTTNPEARVKAHNKGTASKYTRARLPVKLVYIEKQKNKGAALRREAKIKSLSRKQKQALVNSFAAKASQSQFFS